jgi:hypothetical protein
MPGKLFGDAIAGSRPTEREEAILTVTRQKGTVWRVFDRLSLRAQQPLYSLDDVIATGQEELEKFEMCLKWHPVRLASLPARGTDEESRGKTGGHRDGRYRCGAAPHSLGYESNLRVSVPLEPTR